MASREKTGKAQLVRALKGPRAKGEAPRVVHELEVHQEELELQNLELRKMQQLLEESRDRYAELYDFSPVGYVSLDHAGRMRELNLTAAALLGTERSRLAGKPLIYYVDSAARKRFLAHLEECRNAGLQGRVATQLRLATAGGSREVELLSVRYGRGDDAVYRTAITDITARKHAADALRESEAKSRWLIDNMPAVLWISDENGSPRYVSANVVSVLGYTEQEVRSGGARFWLSNVHPHDRQRVESAYRLFSGGDGSSSPYDIEYRRQSKDGSWVWLVDKGMSVSEKGGVRQATGMFWDSTRRKRMQEQLRESEERFRQLAENIDEVFYLTDVRSDEFYYVSPAFERIWGFPGDTLYLQPLSWQDAIHPDDRERVRGVLKARRTGDPYEVEFRLMRPNGAARWIRARGFPIRDPSGRAYRVAGIAEDITARKEAAAGQEQARQKLHEFGAYLESAREEERKRIAREIHDDLGALLLAAKIDLDACRKRQAASVPETAATMEALMGRVDNAIEAVRRISTALRPSILDNVGVLAAVEWQAQDVERRTGISCKVLAHIDGEELRLDPECATAVFRIVQEALTNIVLHSEASKVIIALRERPRGLELRIKDNGRGFDTDHPPESRRWGLVGMAERVRALDGRFCVASKPQRGTTINVFIPAHRAGNSHSR